MDLLKDLYYVNRKSIKQTFTLFTKNWSIILAIFIYSIISIVLFSLIGILFTGILRILAGIALFLGMSALVSDYLYLLQNIVKYGKFTLEDFKMGFKVYLWKIYGILVIGWLISYLLDLLVMPIIRGVVPLGILSIIINIFLLILFNPLPESIYQKFYSSWDTIVYTFNFTKENWIEWLLPNGIFMIVLYFISGRIVTNLFSLIQIGIPFDYTLKGIVLYIFGQVLFSFIMIYRGVLFSILSTSTRRKRMFMRNLYK
ncbi:hypothetical protein [Caldisalinibacter kiritimatiensis]|uniref:Uncharacterized protein n=1 Tax=Caldisalinibacter kiritimatiensis TaxID=1304284 RepID=R1ARY1_9FIRM|nr:hypothetical protein [Caldisalinibacter kiritimatiensis]EOC99411.1 hypothetical protein L21TH_2567 [Caldisalinibacter kiritimatiensis]